MLNNSILPLFKQCLLLVMLLVPVLQLQASEKSSSMLFNKDKSLIYSANFDAGSVSIIDKRSGKLLSENSIGRDIRRIALSADNKLLLASDYLGDKLILLDASDLSVINEVTTEARPFSIVFDKQHQQFYAVSFEKHKLLIINRDGEITDQITIAETPRGLALTDDGRLLITHALTGELSIYDVTSAKPKLNKVLQLVDTEQNDTLSVPQGKPRLLDNIAISPDGTQAWLPHLLWSFGHEFQFQSTVFPAISIIDLTKGKEVELKQQRKLLFKQINIIESGNNQRIVANPHDAAFSEDGKKVIISTAGSEDLIVFDLSRQGKSNKKRHRRKKFQGGVKATQIYRNVPGDNPKALLISEQNLYVQKAMSLDISQFDIGKPGPFSKVKVTNADFAQLVKQDPVLPQMRLGKTLFNSANTAKGGQYPVAGDFWMSCNSCHIDGF
ncbi:MAG: hypothetical protein GY951_03590, partial [Psychromonas sp.]|nr:hypothetical protein [Psychromonas sp.]